MLVHALAFLGRGRGRLTAVGLRCYNGFIRVGRKWLID